MRRVRSYRCKVCGWHGPAEPIDAGDAVPCERCGVYLYPLTWAQVWVVPMILMAATVGIVAAVAYLL
jgi:DNA-directed RNA polymerase subunit RPC12/RpoP